MGIWRTLAQCAAVSLLVSDGAALAGEDNSTAFGTPLPDSTHVLVRKGNAFGGFELIDQITDPESCAYNWWYRRDGKAGFDASVERGRGEANKENGMKIQFGPFDFQWSMAAKGSGWIYYGKLHKAEIRNTDQRLCVTDLESFKGIDASDRKWIYGAKPFHFDEPAPDEQQVRLKSASDKEIANLARELTNEKLHDRSPIWRLVAKYDKASRERLAKAVSGSKVGELIAFSRNPETLLDRLPAELKIQPGPITIEVRTGICFIQNHPVTDERVVVLLKANRIAKDTPITIKPSSVTGANFGDEAPRKSGKRIADLLQKHGYTKVSKL